MTSSTITSKYKIKLDRLKSQLDEFTTSQIKVARDRLDKRKSHRHRRCWHKMKEIDERFNLCRNVRLYVDLCGGPGQFANYISNNSTLNSQGYGVTLRNHLDYNVSVPNFCAVYGDANTGDIFEEDIQNKLNMLCGHRCDLVVADGGIDVYGKENDQELIMLPLIAKQCEIILDCLRVGGNSVLKIFDTFARNTFVVLESFISNFSEFYVFKPVSSRPANAERYLVCLNRLATPRLLTIDNDTQHIDLETTKYARKQIRALNKLLKELNKSENTQ
uniref:Putative methyl transferase n=1 Tax=Helicoverpa armigera nucleopolyhedrovirus TaxID=51313 RepID=A0A0E3JA87_9ABAC|nr:putative methyl transferase [Helicoverpa armigera nucleopolyhedrovirus]